MGKVGKLDKLTRSFLTETSNPTLLFDPFKDLQDPTYMSFKLDFFPDLGYGYLDDSYSTSGLFRAPGLYNDNSFQYMDSAYEYLRNIGSPVRQSYLTSFTNMLWRIQNEAPWFFQSITGLSDIYKIEPNINFRGKDKVLTIECLESIDMRMSFLADMYRNMAFDAYNMREILPINLRTFNMRVYVLEFRRFNTTFGIIADALSKRSINGEQFQKQKILQDAGQYLTKTSLNNIYFVMEDYLVNSYGGVNGMFDSDVDIESAFEAITVHVFDLKDCEFDFFEAPPYFDSVSVADNSNPASSRFKIKVGRIEKLGYYPFHKFIVAEHIKHSFLSVDYVNSLVLPKQYEFDYGTPYIEEFDIYDNDISNNSLVSVFRDIREAIYPSSYSPKTADKQSYMEAEFANTLLRRKPMEEKMRELLQQQNSNNIINNIIIGKLNELSNGFISKTPLGNVYGKTILVDVIKKELSKYLETGKDKKFINVFKDSDKPDESDKSDILNNIIDKLNPWEKKKHNIQDTQNTKRS